MKKIPARQIGLLMCSQSLHILFIPLKRANFRRGDWTEGERGEVDILRWSEQRKLFFQWAEFAQEISV